MEIEDLKAEVRRAARGDEEAAAVLFDNYYPRVFRYARGKLSDDSTAEDVAAETFARVLKGLNRFKWKGGGFEAWLFRIASNLVVDALRASSRERAQEELVGEVSTLETPETLVLQREQRGDLESMLERLAPDQREVLLLRFGADLDTHETGKVMRRSANAIRQLQFRALENLRQMRAARVGER
ncbi:MAG: RNA polymerase sigma factor [Actinomycetota bacterium]|nr:RNA polymerase sigma factor [Actinomycetota bacterium]